MDFDASIPMTNGATDVDPLVTPASVPEARVVRFGFYRGERGVAKRLLLALEASAAETVTLDLYALDDDTFDEAVANRKYYKFAAAQTITHGVLAEITSAVPPGGLVYFRMTADTMAANGILKVAFAQ